jgi:hypothetical protein
MVAWTICPYCCEPWSPDPDSDHAREVEHVLSSAIGGNLEVPACAKCNRALGKFVDRPILDDRRVLIRRATYAIQPIRRRKTFDVRDMSVTGILSVGGGKVRWSPGKPDNPVEILTASEITDHGNGKFTFTSPVDDHDVWLQRAITQLREQHPDKTITVDEPQRFADPNTRFEHSYNLVPWLWSRFAAKIALNLGGLVFGETWLTTREAGMLRGYVRQFKTYRGQFPDDYALAIMPTEVGFDDTPLQRRLYELLTPTEHLLTVDSYDGTLIFNISLFGAELHYRLVTNTEHQAPAGGRAWLLNGIDGPTEMPRETLIGWPALREDEFGSPLRLRRRSPHPSLIGWHRNGTITPIAGTPAEPPKPIP